MILRGWSGRGIIGAGVGIGLGRTGLGWVGGGAEVAELADAPDSKSGALAGVRVRLPPSAPDFFYGIILGGGFFWNRRVAQLAERCLDMAEVTGSNPVAPTVLEFR